MVGSCDNAVVEGGGVDVIVAEKVLKELNTGEGLLPCFLFYRSWTFLGGRVAGTVMATPLTRRELIEEMRFSWYSQKASGKQCDFYLLLIDMGLFLEQQCLT